MSTQSEKDAAFLESYRLRKLARTTKCPNCRKEYLAMAKGQEETAYSD